MSEENRNPLGNEQRQVIIGIDILPGHSSSGMRQPHYTIVVLKNGELYDKFEDASLSRLIRIIWDYKPDILAVDNVFEIAPNTTKLLKIISMLPPSTKIIQVTGWGAEAVNLKTLAKSIGIDLRGKLSPIKTAYLAALIASKGYGYEVKLLEEKTKIIVSRGRSVSHGGMSYNRYIRSVRAGILAVTKEIKKILDKNGFDYDLVFKKARGGLERSVFIVYAPRSKLYGLIKPIHSKSVRVEIKPIYKNKIVISKEQVRVKRRPVIVGLDPGIYTGIAVLDLSGEPILLYSSKNLDRGEIVNIISSIGTPILVSTDVNPPPDAVKKLAAMLKVQLYVPSHSLSNDEKNNLVLMMKKRYPWIDIEDIHERDALAAAYRAYLSFEDKFRQAEARIAEMNLNIDIERVKQYIIKGVSIAEAIEKELERVFNEEEHQSMEKHDIKVSRQESNRPELERIEKLKNRIKSLESERLKLKKELTTMNKRLEELELELNVLKHSIRPDEALLREYEILKNENQVLKKQIDTLRKELEMLKKENMNLRSIIKEIVYQNYIPVPIAKNTSYTNIVKASKNTISYFKAIYVDNILDINVDAISFLEKEKVAILYSGGKEKRILDSLKGKVPVVDISELKYYRIENTLYIEPSIIE